MEKKTLKMLYDAATALGLISVALAAFVFEGLLESIFLILLFACLLARLAISRELGRPMLDERQLRISNKANSFGIMAMLAYCILVALLAKGNPSLLSVPIALGGAVVVVFLVRAIAYKLLENKPNADEFYQGSA